MCVCVCVCVFVFVCVCVPSQLARAYVHVYDLTGRRAWARVALRLWGSWGIKKEVNSCGGRTTCVLTWEVVQKRHRHPRRPQAVGTSKP